VAALDSKNTPLLIAALASLGFLSACHKDSGTSPTDTGVDSGAPDTGGKNDTGSSDGTNGQDSGGPENDGGPGTDGGGGNDVGNDGGGGGQDSGPRDATLVVGGEYLWAKGYGTSTHTTLVSTAVALDGQGNIIVCGNLNGTANLGGMDLVGGTDSDIFIAKYALADGSHIWSKRFGSSGSFDSPADVAVDAHGDVFVTGFVNGATTNLGGTDLPSTGGYDPFVLKVSGADGSHLWSIRLIGPMPDFGFGITVDPSNNVLITGSTMGGLTLGGTTMMTAAGMNDLFVAKYNGMTGALIWGFGKGSPGVDVGKDIAVDSNGDVYVGGNFGGPIDFGGGTVQTPDNSAFVAKYAGESGAFVWVRAIGSQMGTQVEGLATDANKNVVAVGEYNGNTDFGGGHMVNGVMHADIFIARFSGQDGTTMGAVGVGTQAPDEIHDVSIDQVTGDAVVVGALSIGLDLGGGPLPGQINDFYVARFSTDLQYQWARSFGNGMLDRVNGVAVASDHTVVTTGVYGGPLDVGGPAPLPIGGTNGTQNTFVMHQKP
jgi:hypothetical protein